VLGALYLAYDLLGMASHWRGNIPALRGRTKTGILAGRSDERDFGCGFALGAGFLFGAMFGITFGVLSTVGQVIAYRAGIRPTLDYAPATRPRITKHQFLAVVNRT